MATILWDQEIDKTIDWAGDVNTGNAPVSGKYVQKFIKDTLAKKFGYMYYDRSALKYLVFADEDDYNTYSLDPTNNSSLLLATFDAPAPATISIVDSSDYNVTTLLTASQRKLHFNYYIIDKSSNAVAENVSMRVLITRSGESQSFTDTISIDRENYNKPEVGTYKEIELDSYLTEEGNYTITITLTGLNTQASTTLTYFYTVVNLDLSLDNFKYYIPFDSTEGTFEISFTAKGAAGIQKSMEVYIDGEELNQEGLGFRNAFSSGNTIGGGASITDYLTLYNKDINGNLVKWGTDIENSNLWNKSKFAPGKHSIQLRISIPGEELDKPFYSKTKYFDFVVVDPESTLKPTYLLYATDVEAGKIFDVNSPIEITGQQYTSIGLNVAAVDVGNRKTVVNYNIEGETSHTTNSIQHTVDNQTVDTFEYIFDTPDTYVLTVTDGFTNSVQVEAKITVTAFNTNGEKLEEQDQSNLLVKYTALNRSNSELNKTVWENSAINFSHNKYSAIFNNVLWNDQSGWNGEALVLKNGATVELPVDLFSIFDNAGLGLTFEIDFETFDVQNDDALVMDYSDNQLINSSYIKITATQASMNSNKGIFLKTNFKDNTRNKIAFVFNPTTKVEGGISQGTGNPNLMLIYVNGVLDRAGKWGNGEPASDDINWTNPNTKSIIIGNTTGEAGIKVYSIRIYRSSLVPEQAFMNYIVDQGKNIPAIINKNHVIDESGNISLDLVKGKIPTLILSTDYTLINNQTNKKNNTQYELQYFDPIDPTLNFYVRNGWLSCQGTSSMQYPIKNLRPYFNKQANEKTFSFGISSSAAAQALISNGISVTPNFNTEFWPACEYNNDSIGNHEEDVASFVDANGILPYSVNKKEVVKDKEFKNDNGDNEFHEIGKGLSKEYKIDLGTKYFGKTEIYYLNGTATVKGKEVDHYEILTLADGQSAKDAITNLVEAGKSIYISAYRPLLRYGWEIGSDDYWIYIKQLRYSGQKLFTKEVISDQDGNVLGIRYNKAKKLNKDTEYYGLGACWRQYAEPLHYSGWTDKWTLKTDYAESSMCHNSGIARVWGNALRNVMLNGVAVGLTKAQGCSNDPYFIDIRTSCDGKPVVLFVKNPIGYDETTGKVVYGSAEFAGLFNIMTDKSSTPLFGFEDIKDENNKYLFIANADLEDDKSKIPVGQEDNKVQCWEFLQNGSALGTGNSLAFDTPGAAVYNEKGELISGEVTYADAQTDKKLGKNIGEGRPIFTDFEPRWPESGEAYHEGDMNFFQDDVFGVESNSFESFWNWLNFTKPAVNYIVSGKSGYDFSPYVPFANTAEAVSWKAANPDKHIYIQWNNSGNIAYAEEGTQYGLKGEETIFEFNPNIEGQPIYWLDESIDYEDVSKSLNNAKIGEVWGSDVYEVPIYGFDSLNRFVDSETGSINEDEASKYAVTVYMSRNGRTYTYTDCYGVTKTYANSSEISDDEYMRASDGISYAQKTFMQFFSATKYDHLDVYKVAAYYVYIMRFGAVDQVVKNCMMTSEDGKHWYFINYDNDTTLGVRNDAQLIFNWDFDRDTYDYSGNSYAYAGAKSVLWNNLSMDNDFMNIVKAIDAVMYSTGLLSAKAVLEYLDEKQMNVWCERLYNSQEQIKYLSTFKNNFETDKFLLFMQGTRHSHRQWWVNHRWELFDAMWSNGSYADKKIKYYEVITDASNTNELEFLKITAASKYYFTVQKNNNTINGGFVELKAGESASFKTKENIAIGDPMVFIGPHKTKVLNFRPGNRYLSATLSLNETYQITESDGVTKRNTNWVAEGGTMMSKLLIGNGVTNCPVTNISGLNDISSLEEIDIRNCTLLTASPSVNRLSNLHIFRATGSTCTVFEPAQGVILQEVSLPSDNAAASGEIYVTDEQGNLIPKKDEQGNILTDEQGNTIYETQRVSNVYALQTLSLNRVIFQAPNENYVVYQEGTDNDALPYSFDEEGHLTGVYTDDKAYRYTSESKAIFDVQPTARLTNVTFNNVVGLDTKQFVLDWKDKVVASGESLSSRLVVLSGIDWKDITVSQLIEFVFGVKADGSRTATFNIKEFTGTVKVKSDDPENSSISIDEYNRIIEFFGENAFDPENPVFITCNDGIFYQPTSTTKQVVLSSYDADSVAYSLVSRYGNVYELIRGDEFKVKATIFPNDGTKYVYVLTGFTRNNPFTITPSESLVYNHGTSGARLVNNADGTATLKFAEGSVYTNYIFAITVCRLNDDGTPDFTTSSVYDEDHNIYIGSVARNIPVANQITVNIDSDTRNITEYNVVDENKHTVKFNLPANTNAAVNEVNITLSNIGYAENITIDKDNFRIENNVVSVDFECVIPAEKIENLAVTFGLIFDTTDASIREVNKIITFTITPIYPSSITLLNGEDTITDRFVINQSGEYNFSIEVNPSNYNVEVTELTLSSENVFGGNHRQVTYSEIENNTFKITVNNTNYESFARRDNITITLVNKFDTNKQNTITKTIEVETFIVYPENTYVAIQDYNGNTENYIRTNTTDRNLADIYVLNGQGTINPHSLSNYTSLISGSEVIYAKILPENVEMFVPGVSTPEVFEPTEDYTITIGNNINVVSSSIEQVSSDDVNVTIDGNTLAIKIAANTNIIATVTISGTYTIVYDVDRDDTTNNGVNNTYNFTINVNYTLATQTTYTKLSAGEYYLVDENSNYYSVDLDGEYNLTEESRNRITRAHNLGIKFAGVGYNSQTSTQIIPHFIALVDDSRYFRTIGEFTANGANSPVPVFYPQSAKTGIIESAYHNDNDNDIRFNGNDNTEYWYDLLQEANDYLDSGFNAIYSKYGTTLNITPKVYGQMRTGKVLLYIPTNKELTGFFGTSTTTYIQIDKIIEYLNTKEGNNYMLIANILYDKDGFRTGSVGNDVHGVDNNMLNNLGDYDKIMLILTSNANNTASSAHVVARIGVKNAGGANSVFVNTPITLNIVTQYYGHYNYTSILPFVKVS